MNEASGGTGPPEDKLNNTIIEGENELKYDFTNKYRESDTGPYLVFLEHKERNLGRLFPIRVGHFLMENQYFKNNVLDIKPLGLNRVKIICKTYEAANELINHEIVIKNNLVAYIPNYYTHKKGIIRMVDTMFSEEYILKAIESDIKVTEVRRMKRRIHDDTTKTSTLVDRQMVVLTFLGTQIPGNVRINMVNFGVDPYVYPVTQCFKCLRYGHTSRQCKGKKRCQKCAGETCNDKCENDEKKCVHCGDGNHDAVSRDCPIYKQQLNIKRVMAFENLSFKEAQFLVENPSYAKVATHNRFSLLGNENQFPELPQPKTNPNFLLKKPARPTSFKNTNQSQPKKRKTISPPISPSPSHADTSKKETKKAQSVLPNPYRNEYIQYKEQIICQMVQFINKIANNKLDTNEVNIRNQISSILDCDNRCTDTCNKLDNDSVTVMELSSNSEDDDTY